MDHRGRLLLTALGFLSLDTERGGDEPEVQRLHCWLDTWNAIGHITVGMARQGYDLQLTRYDEQGWRANFYTSGIAHSVVKGSAWEPTPWRATHRAAWEALRKADVTA